jgi:phenylpropionate dioxygenase-like ring-hydroxylating dioxygenase large terminal subunit
MAEADMAQFNKVPFRITDPERIPAKRYFDEEFYKLECEKLWPHVWQMACRLEQIPEPGDWIEYSNLGQSILVVRTQDGIKAYHNACRHRGVPIAGGITTDCSHATAHGNCSKKGFVCPFHGWRWNMDGKNTLVYGSHVFDDRQLGDDIDLIPCRVETWAGCAFINFDDNAPSLRESLGPVADRLEANGLGKTRAEWQYGTVLPANWKIAMEAFMEGYHVLQTHPQLHYNNPELYTQRYGGVDDVATAPAPTNLKEVIDAQIGGMQLLSEGMAGMIHQKEVDIARTVPIDDLPANPAEAMPIWFGRVMAAITTTLRERGEDVPDLLAVKQSDPVNAVEFIFPHYFLLPTFTSFSAYRIRPLGPESCFFEIWSLTQYPEGQEPDPVMGPTVLPYNSPEFPPIPRQDYSNIPIQQVGLHAKGFEFMRLGKHVEGLISNYQRIIDGYLADVPQEKLAAANQKLGGNFDGPIFEFDF